MNAESSRLRSTGTIESDISAIWADVLLVVYLGATGLLLIVGHARVSTAGLVLHALVLAAFAASAWSPLVPGWLRRWAPLIALLFLYAEIPMLIAATGRQRLLDVVVMRWEGAIFGTQPSLVWAEHWPWRIVGEALHAGYLSYYAIIFVVPVALYSMRRLADFDEALLVLMITFVVCFGLYVVFPVAGPRYLWPARLHPNGVFRAVVVSLLEARSSRGTAFPSSHVAVAVTQSVLALRYFGRRGILISVLTLLLAAGAVYGGFHYAVDVLAGAALAVLTTAVGLAAVRALRERDRADVLHVVSTRG